MEKRTDELYVIPVSYRKMENMHIIFWLLKDVSWCLIWKEIGLAMIFPTLIISIIIAWNNRRIRSELAHNLAITFWITANSYWMISEFFGFDEHPIFKGFEGKHLAVIPFAAGVLMLAWYYLIGRKTEDNNTSVATL